MIQRIQSVYLLLGALAVASLFLLGDLWQSVPARAYGWFASLAGVLIGLTSVGALGAIFLYTNRQRQMTVVVGLQVLDALLTLLILGAFYAQGTLDVTGGAGGGVDVGRLAVWALPVVAYVLFMLARRAIRSDIALVKSMDRLR